MAHAPQEVQDHILKDSILPAAITDATFTDPDALAGELERVRRQGFSVSLGERVDDAAAIAAPVFNMDAEMGGGYRGHRAPRPGSANTRAPVTWSMWSRWPSSFPNGLDSAQQPAMPSTS